jgi:hypothetical protein
VATFRPVVAWAVLGAAFLAVEAWALSGWVLSGDASPTPTGADPVPGYMKVAIHGAEVAAVVAFVVFVALVVVRPWRRDGAITLDGLFCLVFLTVFWQDTFSNYFAHWFSYNAEFTNLGSWDSHVPGWQSAQGNLIAAPLFLHLAYVWGIFGAAMLGCAVLRRAKTRWPRLGPAGLMGIAFGFFVVVEGLAEPGMLVSGIATYPGSIRWLTLFDGHYYQFPVNEWLLFALAWAAWCGLRYFRDDHGHTIAERGLDRVRLRGAARTGLRFLALTGACNAAFLVCYSLPNALFGLAAAPWPDDVTNRSYFSYLCGPQTPEACAAPAGGPGAPRPR